MIRCDPLRRPLRHKALGEYYQGDHAATEAALLDAYHQQLVAASPPPIRYFAPVFTGDSRDPVRSA